MLKILLLQQQKLLIKYLTLIAEALAQDYVLDVRVLVQGLVMDAQAHARVDAVDAVDAADAADALEDAHIAVQDAEVLVVEGPMPAIADAVPADAHLQCHKYKKGEQSFE